MTGQFTYSEACGYLFPRTAGPKGAGAAWTLEPTRRLLKVLGNPQELIPTVLIGGSNGKGSVVALLSAALGAAGYRVGSFTSPHLVDVRERFQVDRQPITKDAFAMWTERLRPTIEETGASFFEVTTAIGLADFAARHAEIGIVEVGLGGRLDSTNVLSPMVAGVTNVSLEHTEYLGDTREEIAVEKAGIAMPDVPFVVGEPDPTIAQGLENEATRRGADVRRLHPETLFTGHLGLSGDHQRRNAAFAQAVLGALPQRFRVPDSDMQRGFAAVRLAGRFHRVGRWVLDVAHNAAGAVTLGEAMDAADLPRPIHVLFGALGDKDGSAMTTILQNHADRLIVTSPPDPTEDRAGWTPESDSELWYEPDFDRGLVLIAEGAGSIVVTGSFHTVGAAMQRLPGFAGLG